LGLDLRVRCRRWIEDVPAGPTAALLVRRTESPSPSSGRFARRSTSAETPSTSPPTASPFGPTPESWF